MNTMDKIIGYITFGFLFLVTMFCLGWWIFYTLNYNIFYGVGIGLSLGIIMDIIFLKQIIDNLFDLNYMFLAMIYILYSIFIFGLFMGVPVFNVGMSIILGWYIGRRMKVNNIRYKNYKHIIRNANIFGLIILFIVCFTSAYIALNDSYTGVNIQHMLNLNYEVTKPLIWWIIVVGGLLLLTFQYILTKVIANITYENK